MIGGHKNRNVAALPVIRIRYHSKPIQAIDIEKLLLAFKHIEAVITTCPDRVMHVMPHILVEVVTSIVKIVILHIISLSLLEVPVSGSGAFAFIFDSFSILQTFTCIIVSSTITAAYPIIIGRAFFRLQDALSLFAIVEAGVYNRGEAEGHTDLSSWTVIIIIAPINFGAASVLTPSITIVCPDTSRIISIVSDGAGHDV